MGGGNDAKVVTVVMAVYNAESFLQRAIDSVLAQTYTGWNMVCVNDGSTDTSLDILELNAGKDSRITVISKENGGPASARAVAYGLIETEYVVNLDSDDELSPDFLEHCIETAREKCADCVIPDVKIWHYNGAVSYWFDSYGWKESSVITGEEAYGLSLINPSIHGWCFWKSSLLKKYAVGEVANYNGFNEDEYIQRVMFLNCNRIAFANTCYCYHYNDGSITKKFSYKQKGYIDTCNRLIDLIEEFGSQQNTRDLTYEYLLRIAMNMKVRLLKNKASLSQSEYDDFNDAIKHGIKRAISNRRSVRFSDKKHPSLYRFLSASCYPLTAVVCFIRSKH